MNEPYSSSNLQDTDTAVPPEAQPKSFVDETIEGLVREITERNLLINFLKTNREAFEECQVRPVVWHGMIDFNHPTRQEIIALIKAFPGRWNKEINSDGVSMDYTREGQPRLRIWGGDLPPCCKIVEEWQDVPATRKLVRTVKCPEPLAEVAP